MVIMAEAISPADDAEKSPAYQAFLHCRAGYEDLRDDHSQTMAALVTF
jgi:hypothetical protein